MKLLDSATRLAWMIRTLLSRSPVSSHVNLKTILPSVRKSRSRTQQYSASGWSWMNLRLCKAFEREIFSSVFSSFPDLANASSVGSLNHATLPNCVRRSVVFIPNMSTFRAFRSLCVSLRLLARLYATIHQSPAQTHLHASQAP